VSDITPDLGLDSLNGSLSGVWRFARVSNRAPVTGWSSVDFRFVYDDGSPGQYVSGTRTITY